MQVLPHQARSDKRTRLVILALLLIAVLARVIQYLGDVSFWMDELFSIVNIEAMSMGELLSQQPEYNQVAPPGYYFIQKSILLLAGSPNEMVLRFYPVLCSIVSLYLIYRIAIRFLQGVELIACIALIASALGAWLYGTSAKPYAGEQLFMAFFVLVLLVLREGPLRTWQYALIALAGFIGTSSTFLGTAFMVGAIPFMFITSGRIHSRPWLWVIAAFWITGAFLNVLYVETVIDAQVRAGMASVHGGGFPSGGLLNYPAWLWDALMQSFQYFLFVTLPLPGFIRVLFGLILVLAIPGLIYAFHREKWNALLLALPLLMLVGLATLHLLPLMNRFGNGVFWIIPILSMLSFTYLKERIGKPWIAHTLAILLALPGTLALIFGIAGLPNHFDPTEELLARVKEDSSPDQMILVHPRAYLQMNYYAPKAGIDDYIILENDTTIALVEQRLDYLQPDQAWLIVTNVLAYPSAVSVEEFDEIFSARASVLFEHRLTEDTYAILYQFNTP